MTHRAETILEAVKVLVTGLATTGANVARGRAYALGVDQVPALRVSEDTAEIEEAHTPDRLIEILDIVIEAEVAEITDQVDTVLNTIREEITVKLAADHKLGLPAMGADGAALGTGLADLCAFLLIFYLARPKKFPDRDALILRLDEAARPEAWAGLNSS